MRTFRTIRTRLRQAAPWQAARTARNSARCQGKLYCSRRGVDGFPRTFPCRSTVPPVLRQFRPVSFPPLSESSEKSEGSELSSRSLHRSGGSSVLHPPSLHCSAVTLAVPQHTKKCDSIFTRCRGFSPARTKVYYMASGTPMVRVFNPSTRISRMAKQRARRVVTTAGSSAFNTCFSR